METWTEKIIIGILLVAVGWLFGQGGRLFEEWLKRRRIKRLLGDEIAYIHQSLTMRHQNYLRTLQLSVKDIAEISTSERFSHPIYESYYKDVCGYLNSSVRESYERIHQLIDATNQTLDEQSTFAKSFYMEPTPERKRWWRELAKFQYGNLRHLDYLISWHRANPEDPAIRLGSEAHQNYLKFDQEIADETTKILDQAKTLDRDVAFVRYHPEMFSHLAEDGTDQQLIQSEEK